MNDYELNPELLTEVLGDGSSDKVLICCSQEKLVGRTALICSCSCNLDRLIRAQRDSRIEMLRFYENIKFVGFTEARRTAFIFFLLLFFY